MPRKKKSPREMTTEEIARKVFPKRVIETVKEMTHKDDEKKPNESSRE
jgi:hypothetical protein